MLCGRLLRGAIQLPPFAEWPPPTSGFARENRHLYEVMMSPHAPEHGGACRQSLWLFATEQVQRLAGESRAEQAAVALWALLHGVAVLEAAQVFSEHKPANGLDFGLDAWLLAVFVPVNQAGKIRRSVIPGIPSPTSDRGA